MVLLDSLTTPNPTWFLTACSEKNLFAPPLTVAILWNHSWQMDGLPILHLKHRKQSKRHLPSLSLICQYEIYSRCPPTQHCVAQDSQCTLPRFQFDVQTTQPVDDWQIKHLNQDIDTAYYTSKTVQVPCMSSQERFADFFGERVAVVRICKYDEICGYFLVYQGTNSSTT